VQEAACSVKAACRSSCSKATCGRQLQVEAAEKKSCRWKQQDWKSWLVGSRRAGGKPASRRRKMQIKRKHESGRNGGDMESQDWRAQS
jgi:hypothetical protein